ncbi:Lge1p Ecym_2564 [Eremothecium cymbalariae DBVPG|uniref:Transcription regulator LGE1 helical region domain-containing protein n=1 Tax=Eremothecium cymbalariae (strain CBS 270.75 / DBVPG 7215 / KCTC 17166 / NRRL Y-17582) TaxID=931890 RepID=G8JQC4_ERECY|nr:Hypothetical protein Ecym_2564 [Eremothecium cymbalariae DBVPG\
MSGSDEIDSSGAQPPPPPPPPPLSHSSAPSSSQGAGIQPSFSGSSHNRHPQSQGYYPRNEGLNGTGYRQPFSRGNNMAYRGNSGGRYHSNYHGYNNYSGGSGGQVQSYYQRGGYYNGYNGSYHLQQQSQHQHQSHQSHQPYQAHQQHQPHSQQHYQHYYQDYHGSAHPASSSGSYPRYNHVNANNTTPNSGTPSGTRYNSNTSNHTTNDVSPISQQLETKKKFEVIENPIYYLTELDKSTDDLKKLEDIKKVFQESDELDHKLEQQKLVMWKAELELVLLDTQSEKDALNVQLNQENLDALLMEG